MESRKRHNEDDDDVDELHSVTKKVKRNPLTDKQLVISEALRPFMANDLIGIVLDYCKYVYMATDFYIYAAHDLAHDLMGYPGPLYEDNLHLDIRLNGQHQWHQLKHLGIYSRDRISQVTNVVNKPTDPSNQALASVQILRTDFKTPLYLGVEHFSIGLSLHIATGPKQTELVSHLQTLMAPFDERSGGLFWNPELPCLCADNLRGGGRGQFGVAATLYDFRNIEDVLKTKRQQSIKMEESFV